MAEPVNTPPAKIVEPPANPAAPAKLKKIERQNMALELRKQGASYRRIARQLAKRPDVSDKYSEGAAYTDVMDALKRMLKEQSELAEENLRMDLERMDEMIAKMWSRAVPSNNDKPADPYAMNIVLGILDRRARLLNYQQLWAAPKSATQLNIDVTKLPTEALQRIANGEDPIVVLTTLSAGGIGTAEEAGNRRSPDGDR